MVIAAIPMYAAHQRFGAHCGESWSDFVRWTGFHHIVELVSTDEMLCPRLIEALLDADWDYNIKADFKVFFFRDLDYLKRRINYNSVRHNILAIIERPTSPVTATDHFEFCGYDILDSYDSVSVLTNCGGFPAIFSPAEVNRYGLLDDFYRANEIAAAIRAAEPDDDHCFDCRVWSLSRYIGPA